MLVTKNEVKQTSKKLLSVLLAVIMIMTSMSVCFGTFVPTALAADGDAIGTLADKLKDSAYSETLGLLGKSTKSGSKLAQKTEVSFTNYRNFKQAAELLRLLHNAMLATDAWKKADDFSNGRDTNNKTDQAAGCNGSDTGEVYNELINKLELKGVENNSNLQTFIGSVYHMDGATKHDSSTNKTSSLSNWKNTVTYSTTDYKGYLAQVGKASAVASSVEMTVKYEIQMKGSLYYEDGCDKKYHHQFWSADTPVNAPATTSNNTEMKSKVDEHISKLNTYINMKYADMLDMTETLDAIVTELNTAISDHVTYVGSQSTYDSLYADYATGIANFRSSVESAKAFADFMPTVDAWNDFVDANPNYGVFQYPNFGVKGSEGHTKLLADYATFKAYRDYLLTGGSIYQYLLDNNYIDETYYTNFYDNVVAYDLQDSKDAADALYVQYSAVNPGMEETELSLEEKTIAYNSFAGFINNIGNYSAQVVAAVYTSGWQYLIDMREYFKCEINPAVLYFAENAYKTFTDLSTTALWNEINVAKGHQADLDALYNEVKANAGQDKADHLLSALKADAVTMIENLYKTLADRFTLEVNNAWDVYVDLGKPTTLKVDTFLQLSAVIVAIEPSILTDLQAAGKAGYIAQVTIDRYNELMKVGGIYEIWNAYASTFGFPDYKQTQIQYADRTPMEGDELKTANDPVTEAEMNNLIAALDKIITSDTVGGLLGGLLGAEEGEAFNLGSMLTDLIKGALFTDDFINTVVQLLYPLVLNEFTKVWATLPVTVPYNSMNVKVQYLKNLHTILDEGNFEIYPDLLAQKLKDLGYSTKYADNIATLQAAGGSATAWESPRLVDVETGKLKLSWGVTEQKEKLDAGEITQAEFDAFFYQAFEDATAGLLPLLTSLITNVAWSPNESSNIGKADPNILGIMLNISLQLGSEAHNGYADFLVPIYEILGVPYTAVSSINGSTDVAYVLEQILKPVFAFLDKLGTAPVDTLLEILPDLVYALAFRMAKPALNMLRTRITYNASASLVGSVLADGADVKVGDMLITNEADAMLPESMFVGGLNSILAHFGLAIPAIDQATLATLGKLETMSTSRTTWIYDNSSIGAGKAYTIKADKADVGYYLLTYILNIVKDPASLSSLLGLFMTQKDADGNPVLDAEGKKIPDTEAIAKLQETMYNDEGLNLDEINVGNAIAAIVELANQPEYIIDAYNWYAGEYSSPAGESVAMDIYLNPNNDWTKEKAQYLYDNLESLLTTIFTMANLDLDSKTEGVQNNIEELLGGLINGLFTNETVTSLAKLLGSLSDLGALLAPKAEEDAPEASEPEIVAEGEEATGLDIAEILTDLLKNELGIDLSVYAQYANIAEGEVVDFGVTDAETFVAALTELLKPLKPVVDFILGGKDLTLIDSAITLQGYNGYNNAIIPLLEALGATPAAYTADADTLALTLNALVGVINKITTNDPEVAKDGAIYTIIDMLPGVIYYISSNALSQGIDKLLTPVYALLDTIRPIYNVNLGELLAGIEVDFDKDGVKEPLGLDLDNLNWNFIFGLLNNLLGLDLSALQQVIYDVAKSIGVEYTSASTLGTFKKGAYNANFDQADLLTVVLSFVLEWATVEENAKALDEMLGTNGIIAALDTVFADVKIEYGTPTWYYWFDNEEEFDAYIASGAGLPITLAAIDWENIEDNDWDKETAQYFAENIDVLVDKVIAMINKDKADAPQTLAALLYGLVYDNLGGYFTADTINNLIGMLKEILANVDDTLLNVGYELLNVDLVGLKNYECTAEINDLASFVNELARVLDTYAAGLIDLLFFGDDIRLAKKSDKTDTIVINGGLGYEKGLALILEALGCTLPELDENGKTTATAVLGALVDRVNEILADPVNEILDLLPNLIYFLNANGAGVAVDNLLQPVYALLDKINGLGILEKPIVLADLLKITKEDGTEIAIDLANLSLENVVAIVEGATDIPLDAAADILVNFCTGKISKGTYIYKMEAAKEDTITILLYVALELISDDEFAAKLAEMTGVDFIAGIKDIFANTPVEYVSPNWNYMDGIDNGDVIEYTNVIASYPNDWTEEKAEYLAKNLPELVDTVIQMIEINGVKYDSLAALLETLLADANIFSAKTLNGLLDLIKGFIGNIDDELLAVGYELIDVDLVALKNYTVSEEVDTLDEFVAELTKVLGEYAPGVVEWLLLGRDFKLLVKDADGIGAGLEGEAYVTINGAQGYAEGLALLLEALGCENLPAVYGVENLDTAATVKAVLTSLANRIDEIFANPVEEILDLLPNLIYFLDADGVAAVITNTTAALMALIDKLEVFGIELDINSLVNLPELMGIADKYAEGEEQIGLDNLTLVALLRALSLMTELDFTELQNVLVPFALGEAVKYDSVSASDAYKMVYRSDAEGNKYDKHDMISVIVTAALRMFVENEDNAAKLDEMLGTNIVSALKDVFADVEITYSAPEWDYKTNGNYGDYTLTYLNNWNKDTADYVTAVLTAPEFDALIAGLIEGGKYESLGALLNDKVNVFTSENLNALVGLITDLLGGIDAGLLDAAGVLLGVDVVGLADYTAPAGITTVKAFAAELANILNTYAPGVVEWLLLGDDYRFFVKEVENGAPVDFIVINGAEGYANGLALLLEALGCENLPAADGETADIVTGVLTSLANRIDEIFADPINEVIDLLPNLVYFLNTNGVAAVIDNLTAAVVALLDKLAVFGIDVDINSLIDLKKLMGLEETDAAISLDNLSMADVLEAVALMVGLELTEIEKVLVGFDLGAVAEYTSVSDANAVGTAKKMSYSDSFLKRDAVTLLVNLLLITVEDEANAEFVKGLVGEEIYDVIIALFNMEEAAMQEFSWIFVSEETGGNKVGETFSTLETSEEYEDWPMYGPFYTEEMATYIADNFGMFVDNILYLLGLEVNGEQIDSLTELINELLDGSLYNSSNVIAIRDALAGVLANVENLEVNGKNVGKYIVDILAKAEVADIAAIKNVEVPEFKDNKEMFVTYLCDVLEPIYPVLKYVLADKDISFFVDTDKKDLITLQGAEGYAYGIIPLLEVLECEGILDPDAYYAAVEADGDALLTSILNPLLNRVDYLLSKDEETGNDVLADEILKMLPNIIYFINSNGVDTVVKNTLNAVFNLLNVIKPIAKLDLYELIGVDLAEIDMTWLVNKLAKLLADAGYEFDVTAFDPIAELTVGTLEGYTSLNGKQAYRMVYAPDNADGTPASGGKEELVSVVLRLGITFLMHEQNAEILVDFLIEKLGMDPAAEEYLTRLIKSIANVPTTTYIGMNQAQAVIYYVFYSADIGSSEVVQGFKDIGAEWGNILEEIGGTGPDSLGGILNDLLGDDIINSDRFAPSGLLGFFQKIVDWFNKIIEWFKNLFN